MYSFLSRKKKKSEIDKYIHASASASSEEPVAEQA
jgi:hypothetical protein